VDIVLLGRLLRQHEGLRKPAHRFAIVGQLPSDLDDDAAAEGGLRVDLPDLGVAVIEVQLLDAVVDLPLSDHRLSLPVRTVQASVHKRRVLIVEPAHPKSGSCIVWFVNEGRPVGEKHCAENILTDEGASAPGSAGCSTAGRTRVRRCGDWVFPPLPLLLLNKIDLLAAW
jgi:hypothetical protein